MLASPYFSGDFALIVELSNLSFDYKVEVLYFFVTTHNYIIFIKVLNLECPCYSILHYLWENLDSGNFFYELPASFKVFSRKLDGYCPENLPAHTPHKNFVTLYFDGCRPWFVVNQRKFAEGRTSIQLFYFDSVLYHCKLPAVHDEKTARLGVLLEDEILFFDVLAVEELCGKEFELGVAKILKYFYLFD